MVIIGNHEPPKTQVLVVDDNPDTVESTALLFQSERYETRTASNGVEAVERTMIYCPDIVLLDIANPRLDGYAVARTIRKRPLSPQPVLFAVTGYADKTSINWKVASKLSAFYATWRILERQSTVCLLRLDILRIKRTDLRCFPYSAPSRACLVARTYCLLPRTLPKSLPHLILPEILEPSWRKLRVPNGVLMFLCSSGLCSGCVHRRAS